METPIDNKVAEAEAEVETRMNEEEADTSISMVSRSSIDEAIIEKKLAVAEARMSEEENDISIMSRSKIDAEIIEKELALNSCGAITVKSVPVSNPIPEWGLDNSTDIGEIHFAAETPSESIFRQSCDAGALSHKIIKSICDTVDVEEVSDAPASSTDIIESACGAVVNADHDNVAKNGIKFIHPTPNDIYDSLVHMKLIDTTMSPPESYKNGIPIERSLYHLWHINPPGRKCSEKHVCHFMQTKCKYARFVAIICKLVDNNCTESCIDAISVDEFHSVYNMFNNMPFNWFSMYACFLNSCAHVMTYTHTCSPHCIIYTDRSVSFDDIKLYKYIRQHVMLNYHPAAYPQRRQYFNAQNRVAPRPPTDRNVAAPRPPFRRIAKRVGSNEPQVHTEQNVSSPNDM